jgi:hypothetical protein
VSSTSIDTRTAGGVLTICNDQIDLQSISDRTKRSLKRFTPRATYDIAEHKHPQVRIFHWNQHEYLLTLRFDDATLITHPVH